MEKSEEELKKTQEFRMALMEMQRAMRNYYQKKTKAEKALKEMYEKIYLI